MTDSDGFETTATLRIDVPDSELRNARQQIETSIGATSIGMTDGGTASAQAARGGGRQQRRARQSHRWERQRTEDTGDLLEEVRDLTGEEGGGIVDGVLGGLTGVGGDALGAGALTAAAGAMTGAAKAHTGAATALTTAAAALGGSSVIDAIDSDDIDVDTDALEDVEGIDGDGIAVEKPDWVPLEPPEEPEWVPIEVDDPGTVAYEGPETLPYDGPESIPLDASDDTPLEVEDVPPLPVEPVDPIPIQVDVSAQGAAGASPSVGGGGLEGVEGVGGGVEVSDDGEMSVGEAIIRDLPGGNTAFAIGGAEGHGLSPTEMESSPSTGGIGDVDLGDSSFDLDDRSVEPTAPAQPAETSVSMTTPVQMGDVNVETDLDQLEDDLIRAVEDMADDVREDLERQLDDVVRSVEALERALR